MPYPFGKYDQLFVPEFNAGAMENAGCVTFLEDYVFRSRVTDAAYEQRANTILHEMAHMWFGDLVTMRWWDDLWLNESFAEWAAHYANVNATRFTDAWTTFANQRKAWAYRQDQLPSTHPIAADMVDLDAVRRELRRDHLRQGRLGAAPARGLGGRGGVPDRRARLLRTARLGQHHAARPARASSRPTQRPRPVRLGAGVAADRRREPAAADVASTPTARTPRSSSCRSRRRCPRAGAHAALAPHRDRPVRRGRRPARASRPRRDGRHRRAHRRARARRRTAQPELLLLNDDDLTFAKIRLDERSCATATEHLGDAGRPAGPRADLGRRLGHDPRRRDDHGRLPRTWSCPGSAAETDIGVVQGVLRQAKAAIDQYAAPAHRAGYRDRLAAACTGARRPSPAATSSSRSPARSPRRPPPRRSWTPWPDSSTGRSCWTGLAVDTDLRWALLQRLVAHGRAEDDRIELELDSDDTATGRRQAALARAARPTAEAKEQAWAEVVDRRTCPTRSWTRPSAASSSPTRSTSCAPTATATSRCSRASGPSAPTRWPSRSRWGCTRCCSSTTRPSPRPMPAWRAT